VKWFIYRCDGGLVISMRRMIDNVYKKLAVITGRVAAVGLLV